MASCTYFSIIFTLHLHVIDFDNTRRSVKSIYFLLRSLTGHRPTPHIPAKRYITTFTVILFFLCLPQSRENPLLLPLFSSAVPPPSSPLLLAAMEGGEGYTRRWKVEAHGRTEIDVVYTNEEATMVESLAMYEHGFLSTSTNSLVLTSSTPKRT